MVTFSISKATFSDGTEIGFSAGDIIVFVGPNNAGKSVALREIVSSLKRYQNSVVVKEIAIEKEGEQDALRDHLDQNFVNDQEPQLPFTSFKGGELFKTLWARWSAADATLEQATRLFVLNLQTETRLKDADPAPTIRLGNQPPAHPIHHLALDPVLEKTVKIHESIAQFNRDYKTTVPLLSTSGKIYGELIYRICDNRTCSLPLNSKFKADLKIKDK